MSDHRRALWSYKLAVLPFVQLYGMLTGVVPAGGNSELLIPKEEVAKVLKQKTLGPTGMKGLAAIKNVVEKWSVFTCPAVCHRLHCTVD